MPKATSYKDVFELIRSDHYRKRKEMLNTGGVLKLLLKGNLLAWYRMCQIHDIFHPFKRKIYHIICAKRQVDLPYQTQIGYGFFIAHGICMVINRTTIIGNNVNISQFINIGSNGGQAATICDNAYIAPFVALVEDVTIGFNSMIGAGAVVTKDVESNCTYAGVPAKKISDKKRLPWHFYTYNK